MKISAAQADEMLAGSWFEGYTSEVELYEEPVTLDGFDVEGRCAELDDTEMALFAAGLTVRGTLDLGTDAHAIYAVRGTLRTGRLILGDAVLVVDGVVEVEEWLFGDRAEGVFEVAGCQIESASCRDTMLAAVHAPVLAMFDRGRGVFVLRENGESREIGQLPAAVLDGLDPDEAPDGYVGPRLRELLLAGQSIFR